MAGDLNAERKCLMSVASKVVSNVIMESQVKRVQELLNSGMTMEEAIGVVLQERVAANASSGPRRDNIAYINGLTNITEARRCKKIAYAKISKSKGKIVAIARYKEEVAAATKIVESLVGQAQVAKVPWKKAMELGEDAAGAFNYYYLTPLAEKIDKALAKKTKGMTRGQVKAAILAILPSTPEDVPEVLKPVWAARMAHGDMMVITLARKLTFVKAESE